MQINLVSTSGGHDLREMELLARECIAENFRVTDLPDRLNSWATEISGNIQPRCG